MNKYYTRPCNFFYNNLQTHNIKKYSVNGNSHVYFDSIEIISRTSIKKVKINKIKYLSSGLKKKNRNRFKKNYFKKKF